MANEIYREALSCLEQRRLNAKELKEKRFDEVYKKIPKLKEIRESISETSISITKALLLDKENQQKLLKELKENNEVLKEQERFLLTNQGYNETYLTDVHTCNICKDTGFIDNKKCKCFDQIIVEKLYQISNLKDMIQTQNFDSFDVKYFSEHYKEDGLTSRQVMTENFNAAQDFITNFENQFKNIYIYGKVGLGKTFLCTCIAKEILDKGYVVLYVSAIDMFKKLEDYRFNRNENLKNEEFISYLYSADLLIIDDLGSEVQTQFTSSELFNIINKRDSDKKHTIISSNIDIREVENIYSHRLESRFIGNYEMMKIIGEDIRLQKKFN